MVDALRRDGVRDSFDHRRDRLDAYPIAGSGRDRGCAGRLIVESADGVAQQQTTLGHFDSALPSSFVQGTTDTAVASQETGAGLSGDPLTQLLAHAGKMTATKPNLASADHLDLGSALTGVPLSHDLTNIGKVLSTVTHGQIAQGIGHGAKTALDATGSAVQPVPHAQGTGKIDVTQLVKPDTLIPPSS